MPLFSRREAAFVFVSPASSTSSENSAPARGVCFARYHERTAPMKSKNRRVIFQMPETLIQELTRLAEREFTSRGAIVRRLVSEAASKSASA
jgi:hypothetical protein